VRFYFEIIVCFYFVADRRVEERNVNGNAKRQDVDHVFLRFGRRLGL
jgi:hypothetical protein